MKKYNNLLQGCAQEKSYSNNPEIQQSEEDRQSHSVSKVGSQTGSRAFRFSSLGGKNNNPTILVTTNQKAQFLSKKLDSARYNFSSYNGFRPSTDPNMIISSAKNVYGTVSLEKKRVQILKEPSGSQIRKKYVVKNDSFTLYSNINNQSNLQFNKL